MCKSIEGAELDIKNGGGIIMSTMTSTPEEKAELPRNVFSYAAEYMEENAPELASNFTKIIHFLCWHPELRPTYRGRTAPQWGTQAYVERLAQQFINGHPRKPLPQPQTQVDPALGVILGLGYGMDSANMDDYIEAHRLAMVAENVVGDMLERYLVSALPEEWVWCAGSTVRSTDFIRVNTPRPTIMADWDVLQVKNRDNSENSSSSAIRDGTPIVKWHRMVARTGETRWDKFPVSGLIIPLSEEGFQSYILEALEGSGS